jgi:NTP pyrophosphatase (non-canonical NTP hydrolase)
MQNSLDAKTTVSQLKTIVDQFIAERDWHQFHNAKSLSMAIAVEAAELMEHFIWVENNSHLPQKTRQDIEHELVDILFAVLAFANRYSIDLTTAFLEKNKLRAEKYPAELARGKTDKYHVYKEYVEQKKKSNK